MVFYLNVVDGIPTLGKETLETSMELDLVFQPSALRKLEDLLFCDGAFMRLSLLQLGKVDPAKK